MVAKLSSTTKKDMDLPIHYQTILPNIITALDDTKTYLSDLSTEFSDQIEGAIANVFLPKKTLAETIYAF